MTGLDTLRAWLDDVLGGGWLIVAKRLSANDTGQTGGHQVGFFLPNPVAVRIAPALADDQRENPRQLLDFRLISHDQMSSPSLIRYNNRFRGGTRNESRVTGFGGSASSLQDPENTGALLCVAFRHETHQVSRLDATGWLAQSVEEEDALETGVGPVVPGEVTVWDHDHEGYVTHVEIIAPVRDACRPHISDLPPDWQVTFPPGAALSAEASRRAGADRLDADRRLMKRWDCETSLFAIVEAGFVMQRIARGFVSVADFTAVALSVLNRRKARAGTALELQLERIFIEEHVKFQRGVETELGRRPDFLFPSAATYRASIAGSREIQMLAVKTTLKERWRQVLDEADRIPEKHLFTLTEGVSEQQYRQMAAHRLHLVVPSRNVGKYPAAIRGELLTLTTYLPGLPTTATGTA